MNPLQQYKHQQNSSFQPNLNFNFFVAKQFHMGGYLSTMSGFSQPQRNFSSYSWQNTTQSTQDCAKNQNQAQQKKIQKSCRYGNKNTQNRGSNHLPKQTENQNIINQQTATTDNNNCNILNGIKNIVNGFINPALNCDFYSDHNRDYYPKYRKNFLQSACPSTNTTCQQRHFSQQTHSQQQIKPNQQQQQKQKPLEYQQNIEPHVKTVFLNINIQSPSFLCSSSMRIDKNNCNKDRSSDVVAIFTSEDFPELPVPKKHEPLSCVSSNQIPSNKVSNRKKYKRNCSRKEINKKIEKISKTNGTNSELLNKFVVFPRSCSGSTAGSTPFRPRNRQRQISECSDDSFIICFDNNAAEGVIEFSDIESAVPSIANSSSEEDSEIDESSSEERDSVETDDDNEITDNCLSNRIAKSKSRSTSEAASQRNSEFDIEENKKKVRFNLKPKVLVMHTWDYAYRAARKRYWENFYTDCVRFKDRVQSLTSILDPIFDKNHREKVYKERFIRREQH